MGGLKPSPTHSSLMDVFLPAGPSPDLAFNGRGAFRRAGIILQSSGNFPPGLVRIPWYGTSRVPHLPGRGPWPFGRPPVFFIRDGICYPPAFALLWEVPLSTWFEGLNPSYRPFCPGGSPLNRGNPGLGAIWPCFPVLTQTNPPAHPPICDGPGPPSTLGSSVFGALWVFGPGPGAGEGLPIIPSTVPQTARRARIHPTGRVPLRFREKIQPPNGVGPAILRGGRGPPP